MAVKPTTAVPDVGGRLITRRTHALGGFDNYSIKRDWRRDAGDEIRAEGYVPFQPNLDADLELQQFPTRQDYRIVGFQNGGFELDVDGSGVPDGWSTAVSGSVFSIDATTFKAGTRSVKFASSASGNSGYIETGFLPIGTDRKWKISFSAKVGNASHTIKAEVFWFDESQAAMSNPSTEILNAGGLLEWTDYIRFATPPTGARYGKLRLTGKIAGATDTASAWFDSVDIVENDRESLSLNLLAQCRMPNGRLLTFAGTKTALYRFEYDGDEPYFGDAGNGSYFESGYVAESYTSDDTTGNYVEEDYIVGASGFWQVIGSGFSARGNRWQAVHVGAGYMVFNNGIDLPVYYHYPDGAVTPIYELRESGVVSVGVISEFRGALMCFDISTLKSSKFAEVFEHSSPSGSILAKQYGSRKSHPHQATSSHGYAIQFDGSNDYLQVADDATLDAASSGVSIEAYIKLDETSSGDLVYVAYREVNGGGLPLWSLALECPVFGPGPLHSFTNLTALLTTSTGFKSASAEYLFSPGVWYHVAMTFDGSFIKLFVDGEIVGELAATGTIAASNQAVKIGNTDASSGVSFRIAEARVWSTARTPDEIVSNINTDVSGDADLIGCWMMDGGAGVAADDTSLNGNTAAFVDAPAWVASDAPCDSYLEMKQIAAVSSGLTNDGAGVATFSSATAHGLVTGDKVTVSGSATAAYNVSASVTVLDVFRFTYPIAVIGAGTSAGSPVFQRNFFEAGQIGKTALISNGLSVSIVNFVNPNKVKVSGLVSSIDGEYRVLRVISVAASAITGTVAKVATSATVAGTGTSFTTELSTGQLIRIGSTEEVRQVVSIASNTSLTVDSAFELTESGVVCNTVSDYTVLASNGHFTSSMLGTRILFGDGSSRKIVTVQNSTRINVDDHREIAEQSFQIENTDAYGLITDGSMFERVRYRALWSALNEPYTFNSSPLGTIEQGSNILRLQYQAKSFSVGQQITIVGAGINGANLTTFISNILPGSATIVIDEFAHTGVSLSQVIRTSSIGSIVGYKDLDDDSSAVIAALELSDILVVYKEGRIYFCDYTGNAASPFAFRRRYRGLKTPHYRNSLSTISINGAEMHIYRGKNSFYAFDLARQVPVEVPELEDVENVFTAAGVVDTNAVFAFDNPITKEWVFCFGGSLDDKAICYDYLQRSVRTTSAQIAAGCSIERITGDDNAFSHGWTVLAIGDSVAVYGKTDEADLIFGGRDAVYSRNGADYNSVLRSSMWGSRNGGELLVSEFFHEISSHNSDVGPLTFSMYGIDNPAKPSALLFSVVIGLPQSEPLVGLHFERPMYQDELIASGDGEVRLSARTIYANALVTHGHAKRET